MAQAPSVSIQNNFTAGLKTEFTGLNFPENAATDCDNVVFDMPGDVTRRLGFDYEDNFELNTVDRSGKAISTYIWKNVGGDGSLQMLVKQVGSLLYFYKTSDSNESNPVSKHLLSATVDLTVNKVSGSTLDPSVIECEYSSGNGFLFVYHPYCEPIYVRFDRIDEIFIYSPILIQTRDFKGIVENNSPPQLRPVNLTSAHRYNLLNQGWTSGASWSVTNSQTNNRGAVGGSSPTFETLFPRSGTYTFTVASGLPVVVGQAATITRNGNYRDVAGHWYPVSPFAASGIISAYSGTSLTIIISTVGGDYPNTGYANYGSYTYPTSTGYIDSWKTAVGTYPSNSDVWWRYKNASNTFDPATTLNQVTANVGPSPNGHFIFNEFFQNRNALTGNINFPDVVTMLRPRTGTWFAGRVWFTGIDDMFLNNSEDFGSVSCNWSENIYFSQVAQSEDDLARCYQTNDPTSEDFYDLLPTDGGVIAIIGCGKIFKLFPIQNGLLVFCQNGVWFITGSQGIGFTANDYTITKISSVQSMSSTSFVDVLGLPYFWNEEGIYSVAPAQQGLGLIVAPLTVGTIQAFYDEIPVISKAYVRGDYDPINYTLTFIYRSDPEIDITTRYEFNRCLNYNTYTKSFYPYTVDSVVKINSINYVSYPNELTSPEAKFKYLTSVLEDGNYKFTFSEEKDEDYLDFESAGTGANYLSFFTTGFRLAGQAQRRFQDGYVYVFSRNDEDTSYRIQSRWDYANSGDSGRWSSFQLIINHKPNFGMVYRRHKLRGQGLVGQIHVQSVDGEPFDIMGWSVYETQNQGV